MNKNLFRVSLFTTFLFLLVTVNLTILQVRASDNLNSYPQNSRGLLSELKINRGKILTADHKNIALSKKSGNIYKRLYPEGKIFAHLTGYYDSQYGRANLEQAYNQTLLGTKDIGSIDDYYSSLLEEERTGNNLILTIDSKIQAEAYRALDGKKGAIVVINPNNGNILAMASQPSSDPNNIKQNWKSLNQDSNHPLINRATQSLYPPGSSFKIITSSAAIDSGLADLNSSYNAPGQIKIYGNVISNYNQRNYGHVSLTKAFQLSINTVFAQIGTGLGPHKLSSYTQKFGFNHEIPWKLPQKKSFISSPKKMDKVDTAATAIGLTSDNMGASCLQMALVSTAIANSGEIMVPRLVDEIYSHDNNLIRKEPVKTWLKPINSQTAEQVKTMMEAVVEGGTGQSAQIENVKVAGKTGTAELGNNKEPHSWFIAFAPADKPQLAIAVIVENGGGGGKTAAPIAKQIIQKVLDLKID